jgi:hypothetical protein
MEFQMMSIEGVEWANISQAFITGISRIGLKGYAKYIADGSQWF